MSRVKSLCSQNIVDLWLEADFILSERLFQEWIFSAECVITRYSTGTCTVINNLENVYWKDTGINLRTVKNGTHLRRKKVTIKKQQKHSNSSLEIKALQYQVLIFFIIILKKWQTFINKFPELEVKMKLMFFSAGCKLYR